VRIRIREHLRCGTLIAGLTLAGLAACNHSEPAGNSSAGTQIPPKGATDMPMTVTSSAFTNGNPIPVKYTGDGQNLSPPLAWSGAPKETKEFTLIVDDPDAPTPQPWVHWLVYCIPASITNFPEGRPGASLPAQPAGMKEGKTSFGRIGYGGPEPPRGHGVHRYYFKIYALDTTLTLPAGANKAALMGVMKGHVLSEGQLMGAYKR